MQHRKRQIAKAVSPCWPQAAFWMGALWVAVAVPGALTAEESDLTAALEEQQELLDLIGAGEKGSGASLLAGVEDSEADPRIAPRTPIPRDLPVAIFDERKVIIRAGEWGRNDQMSLLRRVLDADGDRLAEPHGPA